MADYNDSDELIDNGQFLLAAPTGHTGLRLHEISDSGQAQWSEAWQHAALNANFKYVNIC